MEDQIRVYELFPGVFDDFFAYWKENIVPAREACNFRIVGAWFDSETNTFTWVVRYMGEGSFAEADAAYYESPMRSKVPRSSGRFVKSSNVRMATALDPFVAQPA